MTADINHAGPVPRVGLLSIKLRLPMSNTLKDKRSVLRRLEKALTKSANLSFAETGAQDMVQWAWISVACVGSSWPSVEGILQQLLRHCDEDPEVIVVEHILERLM